MGRTKELGRVEGQDQRSRRCRGDEGTALVELALLIVPLCLLLFGIIVYGYLMSFRQNMTQAADEGARAGAVEMFRDDGYATAIVVARTATNKALGQFGQSCDGVKMSCDIQVHNPDATSSVPYMSVTVTYHYHDHPLLPPIPIVSGALPNNFVSSSSAQLNS